MTSSLPCLDRNCKHDRVARGHYVRRASACVQKPAREELDRWTVPMPLGRHGIVARDGAPVSSFTCTEIRQRGPLAASPSDCTRPCPIARAMYAADSAWRASLREITIADLVTEVDSDGDVLSPVRAWLTGTR